MIKSDKICYTYIEYFIDILFLSVRYKRTQVYSPQFLHTDCTQLVRNKEEPFLVKLKSVFSSSTLPKKDFLLLLPVTNKPYTKIVSKKMRSFASHG